MKWLSAVLACGIIFASTGLGRHFYAIHLVQLTGEIFSHTGIAVSLLSAVLALHAFNVKRHNSNTKRLKALRRDVRDLVLLRVEHEQLMDLFCDLTGKKRTDLATRHRDGTLRAPIRDDDDDDED